MAALKYRVAEKKASRIIYVTDIGQELHFKLIFKGGVKAGYVDLASTRLDHMVFGMVCSEEMQTDPKTGKEVKKLVKMKSRSGDTVKLTELLNEARARALEELKKRGQADDGEKKM
jgi:arginyl-tRNA synthetase